MTTYEPPDEDENYEEDDEEPDEDDDSEAAATPPVKRQVPRPGVVLPVGEAETENTLHGSVAFTASIGVGGRNDVRHFRLEMPFVVQPDWTLEQAAIQAADCFYHVKATVYDQAGLRFTTDENGVLQEVVRQHFPEAERQPRRDDEDEPRRPRRDDDRREDRRDSGFAHPRDLHRPDHVTEETWDDLVHNFADWYDNRRDKANGKYKSTAPDFKRADDGTGIWMKPYRNERRSNRTAGSRRYAD